MRRLAAAALAVALVGAAPATSHRYGFSTYGERSGRLSVMVDGYLAALHDADAFIPIPVALGLEGDGPSVSLSPESFTLIGPDGARHAAASPAEIRSRYGKVPFDREIMRQRPIETGQYFTTFERGESRFYPIPNKETAISRVHLDRKTWISDVLYFPRPAGGLGGVFALRVDAPEIGGPTEVRFVVPKLGPADATAPPR